LLNGTPQPDGRYIIPDFRRVGKDPISSQGVVQYTHCTTNWRLSNALLHQDSLESMTAPDYNLLSTWQFHLPEDLIASRPTLRRDDSRLLVIERSSGQIHHSQFRDLPDWLQSEDLLVFNNTRVLPARVFGFRTATGGKWEGLYTEQTDSGEWKMLCETRGRLTAGESITLIPAEEWAQAGIQAVGSEGLRTQLVLQQQLEDGSWLVRPPQHTNPAGLLEQFGSLPLPPYMGRRIADQDDQQRYQTTYASEPGAVAAPTAGLHFTRELLSACEARGVNRTELTLHTGVGTFRPVSTEQLSEHRMHEEWCRLPSKAVAALQKVPATSRTIAVGTTSVRTLESAARVLPKFPAAWEGRTALFIQPGFEFRAVSGLITNFHLPGSTLLVLVAAFAGFDLVMEAYRQAIAQKYRFYSYGDAMLIL